jgi:hypothetical protein
MLGQLFSKATQAIFYNWKEKPVQRMLDFDFICGAVVVPLHGVAWITYRPKVYAKPLAGD